MKFVYRQIISCKDSGECAVNLLNKIETLIQTKDHYQFHLSINHTSKNHKIWLFLYDKKGTHESEAYGKTIRKKSQVIKKFKGKIPTRTQLENL